MKKICREEYYRTKSKVMGYRSRAAFKLLEINKKHHIVNNKSILIDLGCNPGSWCQVSKKSTMKIIGVDIKNTKKIKRIKLLKMNFINIKNQEKLLNLIKIPINTIISDMAPKFCGNKIKDYEQSVSMALQAFNFVKKTISKEGNFCVKIIKGGEEDRINKKMKKYFQKIEYFKPKSS